MKKLFLISTAIFLMLFMSCRSDNDDATQMLLTGIWRPDKMVVKSTNADGTTNVTTVVTNECQQKGRINFVNDNSGTIKLWDDASGTCEISADETFSYSYNPDNKTMTITVDGNTMGGTVTTLTNSNLVFNYTDKSNPAVTTNIEISSTKVPN